MIISNCTKKKNWLSEMLTTCLKAPLCKWKSQEIKTQGQGNQDLFSYKQGRNMHTFKKYPK